MGNIEEINFREGEFELSVRVEPQAETVWLNRQQMAQLFDRDIKTIGKHIQGSSPNCVEFEFSQCYMPTFN